MTLRRIEYDKEFHERIESTSDDAVGQSVVLWQDNKRQVVPSSGVGGLSGMYGASDAKASGRRVARLEMRACV